MPNEAQEERTHVLMMAPGAAATDDDDGGGPSSPVLVEGNSGHSGTTLKEHDYIGLSVSASSSSFQNMQQNSSSPASRGHCEKKVARRSGEEEEEFNLNLGATELRLGPTSLLLQQQQQKKSSSSSGAAAEISTATVTASSAEQAAAEQQQRAASSTDYKGFSTYTTHLVHATTSEMQKKEVPSCVDDSLNLGIGLMPNRSNNSRNADPAAADKKFFQHSQQASAMEEVEENNQRQSNFFQHSQQASAMEEEEENNQRQSRDQQQQQAENRLPQQHPQEAAVGAHHQPLSSSSLEQQKQQQQQEILSMQEKQVPEMMQQQQGAAAGAAGPDSVSAPGASSSMHHHHAPSPMQQLQLPGMLHHPSSSQVSQQQQPDTASSCYPQQQQEPPSQYPQESILGNLDRTGIMQEFMAHKLKVQMGQAGGGDSITNGSHYWPVGAEHHMMPHSSPQVPEISCRAASNGPPRSMFPLSKNGVGGAKRGFSEALGNSVPPPPMESRNGSGPLYGSDGSRNNGFVEGGGVALREGSSVGNNKGRSNNEMSPQQSKHHLGAPAPPAAAATTTMYSCNNNPRPSPPSWQQSLEPSGGLFGPFRSQWPATQGGGQPPPPPPPQMSNRAEVSAGNMESNPKAWDSSRSKNVQETTTVASSEITKHPSSDTRPVSLEDAAPTTAPPPRQSQMVGWPPVRNFRKTLVQQQPPRPAPPQERQPRPTTTTPQVTTTVVPLTAAAAAAPAAPASNGTQVTQTSFLVKVYMDGLSIGRKVDLTANNSYERLKSALEDMFQDMFQQFIRQPGDPQSSTAGETGMFSSCSQKLNFLHSSEYVLTYEDRESDLMLVGDVPWEMFTTIVRRLRIMKGVDIARRGGGDNPTNSQVEAV